MFSLLGEKPILKLIEKHHFTYQWKVNNFSQISEKVNNFSPISEEVNISPTSEWFRNYSKEYPVWQSGKYSDFVMQGKVIIVGDSVNEKLKFE